MAESDRPIPPGAAPAVFAAIVVTLTVGSMLGFLMPAHTPDPPPAPGHLIPLVVIPHTGPPMKEL